MLPLRTGLTAAAVVAAAGIAWWLWARPPDAPAVSRDETDPAKLPATPAREGAPARLRTTAGSAHVIPADAADAAARPDARLEAGTQRVAPAEPQERMRSHIEEDVNRYYEDIGAALHLGEDERFGLIRTLAEHQVQLVEMPFEKDPMLAVERRRDLVQSQREDLQSLLGPQRYEQLEDYQKSLGARIEVQELWRSALVDPPVSEPQRRALVRAAIDAGAYYDEPTFTGAESWDVLMQEALAKMQQRDAKMLEAAARVLGTEYVGEIQNYQDARRNAHEAMLRQRH